MKYKNIHHSVRGKAHKENGAPCQDKTYYLNKDDLHVISLADGAGSSKYSDKGAKIVTKFIEEFLCDNFDNLYSDIENKQFIKKIIDGIVNKIHSTYKGSEITDYSSTLLFVAVRRDKYVLGHIGDGSIAINTDGSIKVISEPENGESLNSTYFFTSESPTDHLRLQRGVINGDTSFILMSDGSYECLYDRRKQSFSIALDKFLEWITQGKKEEVSKAILMNMKKFFVKITTDDISLNFLDISSRTRGFAILQQPDISDLFPDKLGDAIDIQWLKEPT